MKDDCLGRLLTAWNDPEADHRTPILDETLSASGFYFVDPHLPQAAEGRAAFEAYLAKFTEALPDAEVVPGPTTRHHGHAHAEFRIMRGDTPLAQGHYFADLDDDGKVRRLIGFY